jgi:DNA-binding MarR family transcriptional regulator
MDRIDRIRAFNRFYTGRLGLLQRSYLASGLPLTEVRVLYELAEGELRTARALAQAFGIDEGYLSRILKRFAAKGWIERTPDPEDARQAILSLTPAGRAAQQPLAQRSRSDIGEMLAGLDAAGQEALCDAMEQAQGLLEGGAGEIALRDLEPGDAGWVISRHGALYAADEGYDIRFEALVAGIVAGFIRDRDPERERAWIAARGAARLGCIFCVQESQEVARLRLFLVEPAARGLGLGRRLLGDCMAYARSRGYRRMVLWTHESHRAACALYAAQGWRMVAAAPGRDFGQDVVDQTWETDL